MNEKVIQFSMDDEVAQQQIEDVVTQQQQQQQPMNKEVSLQSIYDNAADHRFSPKHQLSSPAYATLYRNKIFVGSLTQQVS